MRQVLRAAVSGADGTECGGAQCGGRREVVLMEKDKTSHGGRHSRGRQWYRMGQGTEGTASAEKSRSTGHGDRSTQPRKDGERTAEKK